MHKVKVLIIDDHAQVRQELATALQREAGVDLVGDTGDAVEAVQCIQRLQPDVVLLETKRTDGQGLALCRRLAPACAVLVLTSYPDISERAAAVQAGAQGYLLKNIDVRRLVKAVQAAQPGRR